MKRVLTRDPTHQLLENMLWQEIEENKKPVEYSMEWFDSLGPKKKTIALKKALALFKTKL